MSLVEVYIPATVVQQACSEYEQEIAQRRRISRTDPVADTIEFVVSDLAERVKKAVQATERLSPEQFAALGRVGVSPQTVRRWCGRGELPGAELTAAGWRIPRDARRVRARVARTAKPRGRRA